MPPLPFLFLRLSVPPALPPSLSVPLAAFLHLTGGRVLATSSPPITRQTLEASTHRRTLRQAPARGNTSTSNSRPAAGCPSSSLLDECRRGGFMRLRDLYFPSLVRSALWGFISVLIFSPFLRAIGSTSRFPGGLGY